MPDGRSNDAHQAPPAGPCTMIIFGAAGDLTRRLVLRALYNQARVSSKAYIPIFPAGTAAANDLLACTGTRTWRPRGSP